MINIEKITELIDKTDYIKSQFTVKDINIASSYDFKNNKKQTHSMQLETIYKNSEFINWKEKLIYEIGQMKEDAFVLDIINLLKRFNGFDDKNRFEKLKAKLYVLKEHLNDYIENSTDTVINDIRIPEKELVEKILRALSKLQRNHNYGTSSSEDTMNDYIRDILDESYAIKDQTRQGNSENGDSAGEIDIQICSEGLPVVMIEGIKLDSLSKEYLDKHIDKVLTKYDPNGCPYAFVIIYVTVKNLELFYNKLQQHLREYEFPYPKLTDIINVDTGCGELKHSNIILERNGQKTIVHFYVAHMV